MGQDIVASDIVPRKDSTRACKICSPEAEVLPWLPLSSSLLPPLPPLLPLPPYVAWSETPLPEPLLTDVLAVV